MKIGRNDPCWCGSGEKFKTCHRNREFLKPVEHWEVSKKFREMFSVGICSSPDSFHTNCSKKIVKAHTVPKSSSLKAIERNGHVYGYQFSLENLQKHKGIKPVLIGINKASTFSGFCKVHDDSIFAPIEKGEFNCSPEHCFLLAYRAFCRESYGKVAMANSHDLRASLDKGKSFYQQMNIQIFTHLINVGSQAALRDLKIHKSHFDKCLESSKYDRVRALIFNLDAVPPVMCSGAVNPDFDFTGNRIQDLMDLEKIPDLLSVTSFFDGITGRIVFSWLENSHDSCKKILESLLKKDELEICIYLVQYLFKNFENVFISPQWWESINENERDNILNLLADNTNLDNASNANGLDRAYLDVPFPRIVSIKAINWIPIN